MKIITNLIPDPPGVPQIHGLENGEAVSSGTSCKLTCSTEAGRPPAKLAWFRGHHMMESHYKVQVETYYTKKCGV